MQGRRRERGRGELEGARGKVRGGQEDGGGWMEADAASDIGDRRESPM